MRLEPNLKDISLSVRPSNRSNFLRTVEIGELVFRTDVVIYSYWHYDEHKTSKAHTFAGTHASLPVLMGSIVHSICLALYPGLFVLVYGQSNPINC